MADVPRIMTGIANKQDRLAMLEALVDDLTVEERGALSHFLCRKNDPFHILPLEVVVQTTAHWRFEDIWRYQLVSRQWRFVLASDEVLKQAVARWYTHSPEDSARSSESVDPKAKAIQIQAMRTGRPFTRTRIAAPHRVNPRAVTPQASRSFALKGHRIAYTNQLSSGRPYVTVHDLITGTKTHYRTTAREEVCCLALSSSLIAYLNFQGKLYAQNLSDASAEPKEVRLPSSSYAAFAADGHFCAVVFQQQSSSDQYTLALYDHSRQHLKELLFPCGKLDFENLIHGSPDALLLNAREKTIDIFSTDAI
ncbi:hypothetical protein PRZ48_012990 [Zasmidium cellare]|uniref:F-box domain-containing protein n=1 Tax=Zasmidium cellare TaxID=395010 RepID=A0ABR0E2S1_ZASCE|nr:hypothetical protein PRZ48_012990 [Zasmidium cellare]